MQQGLMENLVMVGIDAVNMFLCYNLSKHLHIFYKRGSGVL